MRVIIEKDPGQSGEIAAEQVKKAILAVMPVEVQVVSRSVPQALITDRPDLAYQREVEERAKR